MSPMLSPRPPVGLVQAQASPTAANPVMMGWPSRTNRRCRSVTPAMASTPVIGRPSSQCACRGQPATTRVKQSGCRSALSAGSAVVATRVTDQVWLSPARVSTKKLPIEVSTGARRGGGVGPVK